MTPKLNAISIVVKDMAASLAFYRQLGLDIPASADTGEHVEVTLPGGVRFMLDTEETVKSFMRGYERPSGVWGSLAFECDSPAAVDSMYWTLTQAGHHGEMEPWDAFWQQRYAVVLDPDGNHVDLYAASN